MSSKRLTWLVVLIVAIAVGAVSAKRIHDRQKSRNLDAGTKPQPVPVRAVRAEKGTIQSWVYGQGSARAVKREFLTFEQEGKITYVAKGPGGKELREGDPVKGPSTGAKQGELLARVDVRDFTEQAKVAEASREQARQKVAAVAAEIEKAAADYALKKEEYHRYEKLFLSEAIPESQLDVRRAQLTNAQAALKAARAQLKAAESQVEAAVAQHNKALVALERASIFAPFDGIITRLNIRKGDYFSPRLVDTSSEDKLLDTIPIVVVKPNEFEITLELPYYEGALVHPGQQAFVLLGEAESLTVSQERPSEEMIGRWQSTGKVFSVSPSVDPGGRSVQVKVRTTQGIARMRDGMFVTCWIVVKEKADTVVAPYNVFLFRDNVPHVFVVSQSKDTVEQRAVKLGIEGLESQEILTGVEPGDLLVTDGRHRLVSGAPVTVLEIESGKPE